MKLKTPGRVDINFKENNRKDLIEGTLKSKILNTNFKSNFLLDKKIKIVNFYLRNKYIVFSNDFNHTKTIFRY